VGNDHDWASRVVGALLADRAQQQPGEATASARADHKQLGIPRLVDQDRGGGSLDPATLDPAKVADAYAERVLVAYVRDRVAAAREAV